MKMFKNNFYLLIATFMLYHVVQTPASSGTLVEPKFSDTETRDLALAHTLSRLGHGLLCLTHKCANDQIRNIITRLVLRSQACIQVSNFNIDKHMNAFLGAIIQSDLETSLENTDCALEQFQSFDKHRRTCTHSVVEENLAKALALMHPLIRCLFDTHNKAIIAESRFILASIPFALPYISGDSILYVAKTKDILESAINKLRQLDEGRCSAPTAPLSSCESACPKK